MTHRISTNHKKKTCLVLYVYAYCLGKCSGLIAVILAFAEDSTLNTRVMLIFALAIGVFTFFAHASLSRRPQTRKVVLTRIVTVSLGLATSSVLAGLAAYYHSDSYSMLFVCSAVFSLVFLMALVGYLVNVRLNWSDYPLVDRAGVARRSFQPNTIFLPSSTILRQTHLMRRCAETTTAGPGHVQHGDTNCGSPCRAGVRGTDPAAQLQPDNNDLPSYEQLEFTEPPKYSELTVPRSSRTGSVRTAEESSETELPPKYEDVIRVSGMTSSPSRLSALDAGHHGPRSHRRHHHHRHGSKSPKPSSERSTGGERSDKAWGSKKVNRGQDDLFGPAQLHKTSQA
ncbi:hypothetical protein Btru_004796 [Bulinus truncatus]|nr:hypothetical protein Btru_004796 [Bulinus truncatus]